MADNDRQLAEALTRARQTCTEYANKGLTEQDTKNAIIEPLLAALGWPKHNLARVRAEYRHAAGDNPVDYALFEAGAPVVFVEAKALDRSLDDPKYIRQAINYANAASVEWALLTNGQRWRLYDVFDRSPVEERCVFDVGLDDAHVADWLGLILPARVKEGHLRKIRRLLSAEERVAVVLRTLVDQRDADLIDLLCRKTRLQAGQVATALQTLAVEIRRSELEKLAGHLASSAATAKPPRQHEPMAVEKQPAPTAERPSAAGHKGPSEPTRLAVPPPGSRPTTLWIDGSGVPVSNWRELLLRVVHAVASAAPKDYDALFDADDLKGRKRRYLSRTGEDQHTPVKVPGGFVEANLSATAIVSLANKIITLASPTLSTRWE
ncbi:MAG: type I restriction enzyme HsdR N-terminal domain-containing protein [Myxococcales bacterium]|nr:type I restriction enzyme HsdR N-terminal domain-containing protein [Myxococcales bacterium]MCB9523108.1 type I restriction enzyme HsdR N-terminal domain-containing protein [Myxococcales bacterium]